MSRIESTARFNGHDVRIVKNGKLGQPWWIAKDVCDVLGLENSRKAVGDLDDDEKNTVTISDGNRGNPNMAIINESGLYSLILRSRKPEAKKFKKWITAEVLPMIRQTGVYIPRGIKRSALLHDIYEQELIKLFSLTRWPLQREVIDASPYADKEHVRYDLVRQNTKKYDVFEITTKAVTLEKCIETAISRGYHQSVYKKKGKRNARIIFVAPEISNYSKPFVGYLEDDKHVGYRATTFKELFHGISNEIMENTKIGRYSMKKQLEIENFPHLNAMFDKNLYLDHKVAV